MQSSEIGMSANPGNAFHPNTWEPEAEGSRQIVGPPYLLIKFQAGQGCIVECCFKNKTQTKPVWLFPKNILLSSRSYGIVE